MKKIETMTPEQEAKVPIYLKKWLDNGRKTTRIDKQKTIDAIKTIYQCAKIKEPEYFFFFDSPIQCQLAANILKSEEGKKLLSAENNLWNNLGNNLWNNLGNNLGNNLRNNLWNNLGNNLRNNLGNNLRNNLGNNLWDNLGNNLRNNLWNNLNNMKLNYEYIFWGNHWTYWVGFYDFVFNELFTDKIEEYKDFTRYLNALQEVHIFIPFDNIVFISDNPTSITLDGQGRLHHEEAPAIMYADGYSLFYMNGIQVPKKFIETDRANINPKDVLALENTEQRMVLMRYVGLANYLKELDAKVIHEYDGYKLMYLKVDNQAMGPYLYMKCPSSGREFLEGVGDPRDELTIDPDIKTCQDALKWRSMKASKNFMTKFNLKWQYHA